MPCPVDVNSPLGCLLVDGGNVARLVSMEGGDGHCVDMVKLNNAGRGVGVTFKAQCEQSKHTRAIKKTHFLLK